MKLKTSLWTGVAVALITGFVARPVLAAVNLIAGNDMVLDDLSVTAASEPATRSPSPSGTATLARQPAGTVSAGVGIVNGDFECPALETDATYYADSVPAAFGWHLRPDSSVDLMRSFQPSHGFQSLDLNGWGPGAIYQDLVFSNGGKWKIMFDMSTNPNGDGLRTLEVDFGHATGDLSSLGAFSLDSAGRTFQDAKWVTLSTPEITVEDDVVYRLQFKSLTKGPSGPELDNIRLVQVPEPMVTRTAASTTTGATWITLELADGSRLIGTPDIDRIELRTDYADLDLKLALVRSIEYDADHRLARVTMQKGDELHGRLTATSLDLNTVFGVVTIPLAKVRRLSLLETVAGEPRSGLQFNGQNYIGVPNDRTLDPLNAMTLECWFRTSETTGTTMVGKRRWEPGIDQGYLPRTGQAGGLGSSVSRLATPEIDHGYQLHVDGGNLYAYWEHKLLLGGKVNDGQWHLAALTWDGTRRRLFQDGVMVAEDAPGAWVPASGQFRIGAIQSTDGRAFFRGAIGQVRLSNIDRYRGRNFTPQTNFSVDADTVGCWKLNEGSGSIAGDSSGHGHEGKLAGNPPPRWITGQSVDRYRTP